MQGPSDTDTRDGAAISIAPGICQEANSASGLSVEVNREEAEVPPVEEAMLDIEILRCEGGVDREGPQLLQDGQPMEVSCHIM